MVNTHEAKTQLSSLLNRVQAGEEIVIARAGRPVAVLVPYRGGEDQRVAGRYAGEGFIAEDFDAPLRDVEEDFYRG